MLGIFKEEDEKFKGFAELFISGAGQIRYKLELHTFSLVSLVIMRGFFFIITVLLWKFLPTCRPYQIISSKWKIMHDSRKIQFLL
jgi:NADH:ubiquinone oxidoreductase subunit H